VVICLEQGASDLHYCAADAIATPVISCFIKVQIHLAFLALAYPGCHGKEVVKCVSVLVVRMKHSVW